MGALSDTTGELDLAAVEELPYDALRQWISDRLQGRDALVAGDVRQGKEAYSPIAEIHPKLSRARREAIAAITLELVEDMASGPATPWRDEPAHQLLLLAQRVCEWSKVGPILVEMAEQQAFFDPTQTRLADDLHYRVLQTLVELGWRSTPEFWQGQAQLAPDRYAGVAFAGLALIGPQHAIALLCDLPWTLAVEEQMRAELPFLIAEKGEAVVRSLLAQCLPRLGPAAAAAIREVAKEEDLLLPADQARPLGRELASQRA